MQVPQKVLNRLANANQDVYDKAPKTEVDFYRDTT